MTASHTLVMLALGVAACAERPSAPAVERGATEAMQAPADSLALQLPDGGIWYTLSRDSHAPDGSPCTERTLEIRRRGDTVAVPLLYTRDLPELLDDSTASARLYRDCSPGDRYRIDLRSGQPTPVR